MVIGDFNRWEEERRMYAPALADALELLRSMSFEDMEEGCYSIPQVGDGAQLIVKRVETMPFDEVRPEKHERFIDIHYLLSGTEKIGFARGSPKDRMCYGPPLMEDHTFYEHVEQEMEWVLFPGQFAIFLPSDVHRPWCIANPEMREVRKALLKLPVYRLSYLNIHAVNHSQH
jgi:biofilm protein TabA